MFKSRQKAKQWLAVLLQTGRVDVARVVRAPGKQPQLALLESFSLDDGAEKSLKRLARLYRSHAGRCTTLLRPGEYHLTQFEAPSVPAAEHAEALRWRFKDMVDFPLADASISACDIPGHDETARPSLVYAAAASASVVAATMQRFANAGFKLAAIDIPEMAQRNVAALLEEENRGLAMLSIDESGALLTITWRGELYAVRRMELSTTQLAAAGSEQRQQMIERVALDLQRTFDNFDRQYGFISVAGISLALAADIPEVSAELSKNLYLPLQVMNLAKVCSFDAVPAFADPVRQAQGLWAIGAALRSVEAS